MESSLKNMTLVLFVITLVAATAVGMVYKVTEEPIALAKAAGKTLALSRVLPEFDNDPMAEEEVFDMEGIPVTVYPAKKEGETVGYAVETATNRGFSGEIRMMIGFLPDGKIHNIQVLQHAETPGLGGKIADPDNVLAVSFRGNNPADLQMSVRKDGGDIDAITASTITSRAYIDAVARGYKAMKISQSEAEEAWNVHSDAVSGATNTTSSESTKNQKGEETHE